MLAHPIHLRSLNPTSLREAKLAAEMGCLNRKLRSRQVVKESNADDFFTMGTHSHRTSSGV